jgi:DNA-binding NarL/FixJ family response regulator
VLIVRGERRAAVHHHRVRINGGRVRMEVDERTDDLQLASVQLEVLALSATGMTTREVATWLGLTRDEVRDHLVRAIVALGARSKIEAVVKALRLGLIGPARRDGHGAVGEAALPDGH